MDTLNKTYEMACCELDELNKKGGNYDVKEIEIMGELVDIIKDIEEVWSYSDEEYSQMNSNGYMGGRSGRMMPMYGRSYARGNRNMMDSGYSRNSNNKDMMINHLQDVMDMAVDEKDRKAISRLIEQMEQN